MKKVLFVFLLVLIAFFFQLSPIHNGKNNAYASTAVSAYSAYGVVNTTAKGLNIRQSASSSAKVIGSAPKGKTIKIIGKTSGLYKITYNKITGFVSSNYVKVIVSSTMSFKNKTASGTVTKKGNAFVDTDTKSKVSLSLTPGATVTITGEATSWYRIKDSKGQIAYVQKGIIGLHPTFTSVSTSGTITSKANAYVAPNSFSKVSQSLSSSTTVTITGEAPNWYRIKDAKGKAIYVQKGSVDKHPPFKSITATGTINKNTTAYTAPSIKSKAGQSLTKSTTVSISQEGSGWYRIKDSKGKILYVESGKIDKHPTFSKLTTTGTNFDFVVIKNGLKLYSQPSTSANSKNAKTLLPKDSFFLVLSAKSKNGKWVEVTNGKEKGYLLVSEIEIGKQKPLPKSVKSTKNRTYVTSLGAALVIDEAEKVLVSALLDMPINKISDKAFEDALRKIEKMDKATLAKWAANKKLQKFQKPLEYFNFIEDAKKTGLLTSYAAHYYFLKKAYKGNAIYIDYKGNVPVGSGSL